MRWRQCRPQAQKAKAPAIGGRRRRLPGLLPWPQVDFAKFGPVERKGSQPHQEDQRRQPAPQLVVIPHVTNHDDADITELEAFRVQLNKENEERRQGHDAGLPDQAAVAALKKFPEFNASLDGDSSCSSSTSTSASRPTRQRPRGPGDQDADKKGILADHQEMSELAAKARETSSRRPR